MVGAPRPLALQFPDPSMERDWRAHQDATARGPARAGLLAFAGLIVAAALGDPWQAYHGWETVVLVRFLVWGPLLVLGARLVSLPRLRGHVLDVTFGVILVTVASLVALMCLVLPRSAATDYPMYWAVLLLLVHVVAPLDVARACLAGAGVIAGYLVTMFRHGAAGDRHFAAHTVFLLFAWALLIAASWLLEGRSRAAFAAEFRLRARTAELHRLTRLQTSILDALSEGVCGVDARGAVTFANAAASRLLDRPAQDLAGARFHDAFHAEPEGGGACPLCTAPVPVRDFAARFLLPDGTFRWVECSSEPTQDDEGRPGRVISFRDVGRRRELEAQLRHSQKMEAIGLFVAGVAHEFNNLLMPILGHVELAAESLPPGHAVHGHLTSVSRAGERAAALVRQLLALGRRTELAPRPHDLSAVVAEAMAFIGPTMDRRISMVVDARAESWASVDAAQVQQVLLNLCVNARDALLSDLGEGKPARIAITVRPRVVDGAEGVDGASRPGAWIELGVADTGPGIAADVLPRVFEPFFTTKPAGAGSGLGLAVLHGIVHQHGGWVTVDSAPGAGTRVACFFPAVSRPASSSPVDRDGWIGGPGESPGRVLLVDDERLVRDVTRTGLERLGYVVEAFESPIPALDRLRTAPRPDVVILDILMPDMDGWSALARIRADDPSLPVVVITGYGPAREVGRTHAPDALLRKPFRIAELAAVLERVIARQGKPAATDA